MVRTDGGAMLGKDWATLGGGREHRTTGPHVFNGLRLELDIWRICGRRRQAGRECNVNRIRPLWPS